VTDPLWANADQGAPEYTAVELRRSMGALLWPGSDRLGARAGVRPGADNAVSLSGTTVTVHDSQMIVYPGESFTDAPYWVHFLEHTHALDAADGSNDRIDIIVARVYDDDHDASGMREAVTEYVAGNPAADPDPPATPAGALLLAEITVPSGGSPAPSLQYVAPFHVAVGGVLPVRDGNEGPDSGRYHGMVRYRQDTDTLEAWDGSTWVPIAQKGWETIVDGVTITSNTTFPIASGVYSSIRVRLRGWLETEGRIGMRVNNDETAGLHRTAWAAYRLDTGEPAASNSTDTTLWPIAQWSTIVASAEALIVGTDQEARLNYHGFGFRPASGTTIRQFTLSGGDLSATRLLDSLRISSASGSSIDTCTVWIEGYRA